LNPFTTTLLTIGIAFDSSKIYVFGYALNQCVVIYLLIFPVVVCASFAHVVFLCICFTFATTITTFISLYITVLSFTVLPIIPLFSSTATATAVATTIFAITTAHNRCHSSHYVNVRDTAFASHTLRRAAAVAPRPLI
jgi:hypothetical protein